VSRKQPLPSGRLLQRPAPTGVTTFMRTAGLPLSAVAYWAVLFLAVQGCGRVALPEPV